MHRSSENGKQGGVPRAWSIVLVRMKDIVRDESKVST